MSKQQSLRRSCFLCWRRTTPCLQRRQYLNVRGPSTGADVLNAGRPLRHRRHLIIVRRRLPGRVRLTNHDRWFFIQL